MNKIDEMLVEAAKLGLTQVVRQMLEEGKVDPKAGNSRALYVATCYGHTDCVKLLIPVSDPKANDSWALYLAAYHGRTDCVKLLIPVSDPKDYARALARATCYDHTDCAKLLQEAIDTILNNN